MSTAVEAHRQIMAHMEKDMGTNSGTLDGIYGRISDLLAAYHRLESQHQTTCKQNSELVAQNEQLRRELAERPRREEVERLRGELAEATRRVQELMAQLAQQAAEAHQMEQELNARIAQLEQGPRPPPPPPAPRPTCPRPRHRPPPARWPTRPASGSWGRSARATPRWRRR